MFTGIILTKAKLVALERKAEPIMVVDLELNDRLASGDSLALNGVCLTLVAARGRRHSFNLSGETLRLANFADLAPGAALNVELPLRVDSLLSGHWLSGHIDGTCRLRSLRQEAGQRRLTFTYQNPAWRKFLIPKGSLALNGVSLTVQEVGPSFFSVLLIPLSWETTNFRWLRVGERVNVELDLVAKYLYNFTIQKSR